MRKRAATLIVEKGKVFLKRKRRLVKVVKLYTEMVVSRCVRQYDPHVTGALERQIAAIICGTEKNAITVRYVIIQYCTVNHHA